MCHGAVVITTAQLHSTKPELSFCTGSNPAHGMSEIWDGEDLWQWSRLEIRLNAFCQSTIPQKQKWNQSMIAYYRVEIYVSFKNFLVHMYLKLDSLTEYSHWDVKLIVATFNPQRLINKKSFNNISSSLKITIMTNCSSIIYNFSSSIHSFTHLARG